MKTKSTIPKGWTVKTFKEIFEFKNGINADKSSYGVGVKFINVMEIIYNDLITEDKIPGSVQVNDAKKNIYSVKAGDVLFNRTSETTDEVGLSAVFKGNEDVVFGGFVIRGRCKGNDIDDDFKKYCFRSSFVRKQIILRGQGAVRSNIGQADLETVEIILPPIEEQKKIAAILSKWDEAIELQGHLVWKKEEYKKGLINQLLTREIRFSEFNEDWKLAKVCDVFEFLSSNSFSRNQLEYKKGEKNVYNIHYGDIHSTYEGPVLDLSADQRVPVIASGVPIPNRISYLKDGDLVIADASEDYKGVGELVELVGVGSKKVVAGLHTFALRDKNNLTTLGFRSYLFKHPDVSLAMKVIATGSKVFGISKTNFANIEVFLPNYHEQQKIASVFSAIDDEIKALKQELKVLELQKKGLMQELLTGRISVSY